LRRARLTPPRRVQGTAASEDAAVLGRYRGATRADVDGMPYRHGRDMFDAQTASAVA
jgi:hypothetical protein